MVTHGRDGWELADYDWDPATGIAKLTYERHVPEHEEVVVTKAQPAGPQHAGWHTTT